MAALAAFLLLAPAAAAAAAPGNASAAGLSAVERGLVLEAQPVAWAKECLAYWQATDSLPSPDPADFRTNMEKVRWRRTSSRKATFRD